MTNISNKYIKIVELKFQNSLHVLNLDCSGFLQSVGY